MKTRSVLLYLFILITPTLTLFARDVVVSTTAELTAACQNAAPGDVILVSSGTYQGPFLLDTKDQVTIKSYNGTVNLLGSASEQTNGIIILQILNSSNIRIQNLTFKENWGNFADGVQIRGSGDQISVSGCEFFNIGWAKSKTLFPNASQTAHALIAVGTTATPISNVFFGGNTIRDCITGYSESMTLAGNVTFFLIENNLLEGNTNIGIDAAGHFSWTGAPADVNFSRSGIIRKNTVRDYAGPAELDAAGGIYVDGGSFITVENNIVSNYKVGYSIGCEVPGKSANGNIVRSNLAYNCSLSGLFVGSNSATSSVNNTSVYNNTFYKCGFGTFDNGQIAFQNGTNTVVKNNILYPTAFRTAMVQFAGTTSSNLQLSNNLYWRDSGNTDNLFYGLTAGENALRSNPNFTNVDNNQFTLNINSPAINSGDSGIVTDGETDLADNRRILDGQVDIGAYETALGTIPPTTSLPQVATLESSNYPDYFIQETSKRGRIDNVLQTTADAQWRIVPGLAGQGVSFESVAFPNHYLRHQNYEVWLAEEEQSQLFKEDATFFQRSGLADTNGVSFESFNFPGRYIRHSGYALFISQINSNLDAQDATFLKNSTGTQVRSKDILVQNRDTVLSIVPVPAVDYIKINGVDKNEYIQIYTMTGKRLYKGSAQKSIDISTYPQGIYMLKSSGGAAKMFQKR